MFKTLSLSLLLLVSLACLQAQTAPQSSAAQASGDQGSQVTVEGCLQGSTGSYTLTADNGTTYALTGNTDDLKAHVGHQVQITGKTSGASTSSASSTSGATTSTTASTNTLDVQSMKHVATSCKSAAK